MHAVSGIEGQSRPIAPAPIPARAGVGLKPEHGPAIREGQARVAWFEVHAENYMGAGGRPHRFLTEIRRDYPLSVHGVGLSIGGAGALDRKHLARLKAVVDRYEPGLVSEHLAWSTHEGTYLNDLLPLPYTPATLDLVADHIDEVQETIGRRMLLENPSTYVRFAGEQMSEIEFLSGLARRTGCGLLLDVNNVFVSAVNHGYSPRDYIDGFPVEHVGEIHLGGHFPTEDETGAPLLIDAHDRAVIDAVWQLYRQVIERAGPLPTLIEWDNDVPDWPTLAAEARRADDIVSGRRTNRAQA